MWQRLNNIVNEDITWVQTKLRHVAIHNHLLGREACQGWINIEYVESKGMIADGFMKALPTEEFHRFRDQIELADIGERIKDQNDGKIPVWEGMLIRKPLCVLAT